MNKETLRIIILAAIILVTFSFAFISTYYFFYVEKRKVITKGLDDKEIEDDIESKRKKFFKKKENKFKSFKEDYFAKKHSTNKVSRVLNIVFSVILVAFTIFLSISYVNVKNNNLTFINNGTVLVIQTTSMEKGNDFNTYLERNKSNEDKYKYINTRFERYSLIGITKYEEGKTNLNLYDIVAYKVDDTIIVHRLISIRYDQSTNQKLYTFRGDANSASLVGETNITSENFIGVYNGYKNVGLGYFVAFLQSEVGLITLIVLVISIVCYQLFDDKINSTYKNRFEELLMKLQEEIKKPEKKVIYYKIKKDPKYHVKEQI